MSKNKFRIGLDVDGVCLDFGNHFINHCKEKDVHLTVGKTWDFFAQDIRSYDIFDQLTTKFWIDMKREPKSSGLNIEPVAYISHRSCPVEVTKKSLINAGFPDSTIFHVKYTEDKIKIARNLNLDLFIDDRASTVTYFLESGINAVLLDQIWNEDYNLPRIKNLSEIKKHLTNSYRKGASV